MSELIRNLLNEFSHQVWGLRPRVFLSYRRRGDAAGYAGRLEDRLVQEFGREQVFRDIALIKAGSDFVETITDALTHCKVLVALIGPDWLTGVDAEGRSLNNPGNFLHIEIASALQRNIHVIPVLVGGASMPSADQLPPALKPLASRQAMELSESRWHHDLDALVAVIASCGVPRRGGAGVNKVRSPRRWGWVAATGLFALVGTCSMVAIPTISLKVIPFLYAIGAAPYEYPPAPVGPDPTPNPRPYTPPVPNTRDRQAIIASLENANAVQTRAFRELDASVLTTAFTDPVLRGEVRGIEELRATDLILVISYSDIRLLDLTIQGTDAYARVEETFGAEIQERGTGRCVQYLPPRRGSNTVHLVRRLDRWMVANMESLDGQGRQWQSCS